MHTFKTPAAPVAARSALQTLKMLGHRHRKKLLLTFLLNNRLKKEVGFVSSARAPSLAKHYGVLAGLRIRLSDREAIGYLAIGSVIALLFAMTLISMTLNGVSDAGQI